MKVTFDKFLAHCEKHDLQTGIELSNYVIDAFIMSNPDMTHMSRPDWLKVAIDTYQVVIGDTGFTLEPIN